MSAADRMAVRTPDGNIRSVPRRIGLAMIAQSRAKHAPRQSAPRPGAKGQRPVSKFVPEPGKVTLAPGVNVAPEDVTTSIHVLSQTPGQIAETMRTGSLPGGPAHSPEPETGFVDLADPEHGPVIDPAELFEEDDPTALPVDAPVIERPKGNAGRGAWADYALAHGVEVTDEMRRNDIRDAVVAKLDSDRMSRPAFTDHSVDGGRPATPEDVPVTEDMVTSADPGERTT